MYNQTEHASQQAQNAYLIQQFRGNGCCNANFG